MFRNLFIHALSTLRAIRGPIIPTYAPVYSGRFRPTFNRKR